MAKTKTPNEEKFENQDFDLFGALAAIEKKDYGYYDRLTEEQKKKFTPFMMIKWFTYVNTNNTQLEQFYLLSANEYVNKYLFNENVYEHPKLIWLMLCAASPGNAKFMKRSWIPQIREKVSQLKEECTEKEIKDYYTKTYPNTDKEVLDEISSVFTRQQNKKYYLAQKFPNLKYDEIEVLAQTVTDEEIDQYEKDSGNV